MIPTLATCAVGALGAAAAVVLGLPMPLIVGPAVAVAVGGLAGLPLSPHARLREAVFLLLGIGIGAGVSPDALRAAVTWPAAFAALPLLLAAMMAGGRALLVRGFGFDSRSALLASTPGHLSFVFAMGESLALPADRILLVQSIRLLMLTLLVPFAATLAGIDTTLGTTGEAPMTPVVLAVLLGLALLLGPILDRLKVPAPLMMAGLGLSATAHAGGLATGGLHPILNTPALIIVGALMGSRFAGVRLRDLIRFGAAGLCSTTLAAVLALAGAVALAPITGIPVLHLLVALAPGGLQTMVIIGAAMGANPAFLAAMHVARLVILSALIPLWVRRP